MDEDAPVFKKIDPLVMPSFGVLIKISPEEDVSLNPEVRLMEPPSPSVLSPALIAIVPPEALPEPDDKNMSPPSVPPEPDEMSTCPPKDS